MIHLRNLMSSLDVQEGSDRSKKITKKYDEKLEEYSVKEFKKANS